MTNENKYTYEEAQKLVKQINRKCNNVLKKLKAFDWTPEEKREALEKMMKIRFTKITEIEKNTHFKNGDFQTFQI